MSQFTAALSSSASSFTPAESQSKLSSSPSKSLRADLTASGDYPIIVRPTDVRPPSSSDGLGKTYRHITRTTIKLPQRFASWLMGKDEDEASLLEESRIWQADDEADHYWSSTSDIQSRGDEIVRQTNWCLRHNASEASWNNKVHSRVLDLALPSEPQEHTVNWDNISSARIHPESYGPPRASQRKVDFAIFLELSRTEVEELRAHHCFPVNATDYAPLLGHPIAVNIETKPTYDDFKVAKTQLGIWLFAQLSRLSEIFGQAPDFLPLLIACGDQWIFLLAWQATDDAGRTTLYIDDHTVPIGSTKSALGVVRICLVLKELYRWANKEYRSWITAAWRRRGGSCEERTRRNEYTYLVNLTPPTRIATHALHVNLRASYTIPCKSGFRRWDESKRVEGK